ncbi:hypothetical protein SAMN05661008_00233 [Alkalithermobacter thermoalcaliphilus JW-YL-7 = DSM 7308]|uniref:Uncharacterized protein n=1 Tax=Alkalithermobacter thermoalcaliphilus JW-YL-7 = DSM 7308 TaxID=1121328 RepID=A0A150FSR3_CLOPD|nr:hypothetical protein JWYL7_1290 [[Clostridium] paradoxum JW-YL-7 = DSM 7308]SHK42318.1 hypothetical protein SAMN05661008_00233 [[Clostridium] paradoxum JW-YL-7 = DSM 7308]
MSCKPKFFKDFDGWWIIVLLFLFLAFQDCTDISIEDWIPFLIILLILCSCDELGDCC